MNTETTPPQRIFALDLARTLALASMVVFSSLTWIEKTGSTAPPLVSDGRPPRVRLASSAGETVEVETEVTTPGY